VKRAALTLLVVCLGAAACGRGTPAFSQKLVVIGFDGMDAARVRRWMDQGKLPNLRKLVTTGGFYPLATTASPETAPAWSSFATGTNPGKHGMFGTLARDPATYALDPALFHTEPGRFLFGYLPIARPAFTTRRGGTPFWTVAGREGVRASVINVPMTFPPEELPNGELLSGLPLPDLRGTLGTFSYFATDLSGAQEGPSEYGGILKRLIFEGEDAQTELEGPPNPIVAQPLAAARATPPTNDAQRMQRALLESRASLRLPVAIHWNRAGRSATIDVGDTTVHLQEGEWSKWIDLDFEANLFVRLHGMAQLYLVAADKELQLYVSPINWRPDEPPAPMSWPHGFASDLYERLGPYRTLGWAEATWPLDENRIDERTFMDDLYRALDDRMQLILQRLDAHRWDLLVGVIGSTDRVSHMMWRLTDPSHPMYDRDLAAKFGDTIEDVYRRCDEFVGEVMSRLEPGTTVLVVSGYGFHSFRRAVNLNTWLVEQGFMVLKDAPRTARRLTDVYAGGPLGAAIDWSRTRAYAAGFGQVYLNLQGRERHGIVAPGADARALLDDLSARLLALTDGKSGAHPVAAVYKAADIYRGPYLGQAPDLQVGFAEGYRVSWPTVGGDAPAGVIFYPNMEKWSGDHSSFDAADTGGLLISNRPLSAPSPRLVDIAPSVLKYFGLAVPSDMDGHAIF
jgi:predicted AlkP superfamily phosphohydrolase/phosphomutase